MGENLHYIDRIFKNAFEEYKEVPSLEAWKTINERLDTKKVKESRPLSWWKTASCILFLISFCLNIHDVQPRRAANKLLVIDAGVNKKREPVGIDTRDFFKKSQVLDKDVTTEKSKPGMLILGVANTQRPWDPKQPENEDKEPAHMSLAEFQHVTTPDPGKSITFTGLEQKAVIAGSGKGIASANKPTVNKSPRLSAIIFFSPDFSFYRFQNDVPYNGSGNDLKDKEKPDLSSTTGVLIDYRLSDHWSLQSGVSYSNTNILIDPKTIYAEKDNNGSVKYRYNASSGYGYVLPSFSNSPSVGDSLYAFSANHTLQYLNIPAAVRYNIKKGKFKFFASAGISANFLLRGIIETPVQNSSNNETEVIHHLHGLKKIYFSGLFNIGGEYRLNKKFSLMISPTRRVALNSINKNVSVKSYPSSFGIATGIRMDL